MRRSAVLLLTTIVVAGGEIDRSGLSSAERTAIRRPAATPAASNHSARRAHRSSDNALRVGVVNTTGWGVDRVFTAIGVHWTRLDVGRGRDLSLLVRALDHGMQPLPLYASGPDGNLTGLTPAQCADDVRSLAPRLRALGITELEFGNEVYQSESATQYAAQYDAAHAVAATYGLRLLATATTDFYDRKRGGTGNWFRDLAAALPGGPREVDAFTLHPYGPITRTCYDGYGWPMTSSLHAESIAAGFSPTLPWYITELGQELSGSGDSCQPPVRPSTQAADLVTYLNDVLNRYPWVTFVAFYAPRDDDSGGFGLLNDDNTPRPAFDALKRWLRANAASVQG
jgi:hypothetical protein